MARPKHPHPTPAELEVLQVLWGEYPLAVRDVMERLSGKRGYTTVMSLLQVMFEKNLVTRKAQGRAFLYSPKATREKTLGKLIGDLLGRAFEGSSSALVAHLLDQASPDDAELAAIREVLAKYEADAEELS